MIQNEGELLKLMDADFGNTDKGIINRVETTVGDCLEFWDIQVDRLWSELNERRKDDQ